MSESEDPTWGESLVGKFEVYIRALVDPNYVGLSKAKKELIDEVDEFLEFAIQSEE